MGFGASTSVGNVSVDMVQADVDAIIAGIADGQTLSDLDSVLDNIYGVNSQISMDTGYLGYLYSTSAGYGVADLLYTTSGWMSVADLLYDSSNYYSVAQLLGGAPVGHLYSSSAGYGVADLLYNSSAFMSVGDMLYDGSTSLSVAQLLGNASWGHPYEISYNSSYLYSSTAGYGVADQLYYYLYDSSNYRGLIDYFKSGNGYEPFFYSGYSIASMLYAIKQVTDQMNFANGRLQVESQPPA